MSCHSQIKPAISKAPDFKIYKTQEETFHASTHILMRVISVQHERYIFRKNTETLSEPAYKNRLHREHQITRCTEISWREKGLYSELWK